MIKNIGIYAHVDAGKTTLTEQLLYHSGAIKNIGRVDNGTTITDSNDIERARGISIYTMPTSYNYKEQKINIIDTPGHVDFIAEVERSMLVLDGAILVISAREGVQSHTSLLFKTLHSMKVPTIIFINKIDRIGVDINKVIDDIKTKLNHNILIMQNVICEGTKTAMVENIPYAIDDELIDQLYPIDNDIIEDYLQEKINQEYIINRIKLGIDNNMLYPIVFGSALKSIGITNVLDMINEYLPCFKKTDSSIPSGVAFKIYRMNKMLRTVMVKLTAGALNVNDYINDDKITGIYTFINGHQQQCGSLYSGDIGIIVGLHSMNVTDVFGDERPLGIQSFGKPTLKVRVIPSTISQRRLLLKALSVIKDSDPYLSYELTDYSDDIYVNLFGFVQMEIIKETLLRDYNIIIEYDEPMTIFMERPIQCAKHQINMHQDGQPYAAGIGFMIEPLPLGSGIEYDDHIGKEGLTRPYLNGVRDGIYDCIVQGLYGWEITDIKITLINYQYDSVSSTPSDYRNLSPLVLFGALKKCGTQLLWPLCEYKLTVPTKHIGKGISDLKKMYADVNEPVIIDNNCVITGLIPFDLISNYEHNVYAYTSGLGHFESRVKSYDIAPDNIHKERKKYRIDPSNQGLYIMKKLRAF